MQLDYIQGMGFTAIWISPVTEQLPQDTPYGEAYHGYWQQKMYVSRYIGLFSLTSIDMMSIRILEPSTTSRLFLLLCMIVECI